jgi:hypothetical protein
MSAPDHYKIALLDALLAHDIHVLADQGTWLEVEKGYTIEIESNGLYKLLSEGMVVAPFQDLAELCEFIKM